MENCKRSEKGKITAMRDKVSLFAGANIIIVLLLLFGYALIEPADPIFLFSAVLITAVFMYLVWGQRMELTRVTLSHEQKETVGCQEQSRSLHVLIFQGVGLAVLVIILIYSVYRV